MFRHKYPAAWTFHRHTARWPFNVLDPDEEPWPGAGFKEHPLARIIRLPPAREVRLALGDAIRKRICCRNFAETPLAIHEVATIMSLAYGVQGTVNLGAKEHLERPVPSGGGLYPLEIYAVVRNVTDLDPGIYHYLPLTHSFEEIRRVDLAPALLSQAFMNQPYLAGAGVILIISAIVERLMHKYGDRGYRYILFEAGHVAQNVCLAAAGLDLGALPVGGFFDGYLAEFLDIDIEDEPLLYGVGIGRCQTTDRIEARNVTALLGD
jgi:SagB-type dehydrogenase family enzyme